MIDYTWEADAKDEFHSSICDTINYILQRFHKDMDVEVLVTGGEEIHRLNLQYREIDMTTDVLSFPSFEGGPGEVSVGHLGSIAISFDRATEQAEEYGHSLKRELCFLCTHGMLHLLGYDHIEPREEAEMNGLAEDILAGLQIYRS